LINIEGSNGNIVRFKKDGTTYPTNGALGFEAKVYDTNTVLQNS
jgi:hypothetical protein